VRPLTLVTDTVLLMICVGSLRCAYPVSSSKYKSARHDPHAQPSSVEAISVIRVNHMTCGMIACPLYGYSLRKDGRARYQGHSNVAMIGSYVATIDSSTFLGLAKLLIARGFFRLRNSASACDDCGYAIITAEFDGVLNTLQFDYVHDSSAIQLAAELDSAAAHLNWTVRH